MIAIRKPSREEFASALTDRNVKSLQLIQAALGFGVAVFAVVVVVVYYVNPAAHPESDISFMWVLTLVQFAIGYPMFGMSFVLYKRRLSGAVLSTRPKLASPENFFMEMRTAIILRLAFMEGAALYGLVICLLGSMNGTLQAFPVFWINVIGALGMLLFISWSFPTKDRLMDFYTEDVMT